MTEHRLVLEPLYGTGYTSVVVQKWEVLLWVKTYLSVNKVLIGNNVKIQNNVSVYDNVTLQDDVFCGPSMVFTNVYNPRSSVSRKNEYRDTLVKVGATLGANSTIVCGVTIGEYMLLVRVL